MVTERPEEHIDRALPVGDPARFCEFCGDKATLRLYRDGVSRAVWACEADLDLARRKLGGAHLVRHL